MIAAYYLFSRFYPYVLTMVGIKYKSQEPDIYARLRHRITPARDYLQIAGPDWFHNTSPKSWFVRGTIQSIHPLIADRQLIYWP